MKKKKKKRNFQIPVTFWQGTWGSNVGKGVAIKFKENGP